MHHVLNDNILSEPDMVTAPEHTAEDKVISKPTAPKHSQRPAQIFFCSQEKNMFLSMPNEGFAGKKLQGGTNIKGRHVGRSNGQLINLV